MAPEPLLFPATSKEEHHGKAQGQANLFNQAGSTEKDDAACEETRQAGQQDNCGQGITIKQYRSSWVRRYLEINVFRKNYSSEPG